MMKITHVITGLNSGGAEAVLYRLVSGDVQSGNRHTVISMMDRGAYAARLKQVGCPVLCLGMPRGRLTARGLVALYRHLKRQQPDVVQTWMYHANMVGGLIARMAGIHNIVWGIRQSNLDRDKNSRLTLAVIRISAWFSGCVPARIICCSNHAIQLHASIGFCSGKMTLIHNGFDLNQFDRNRDTRDKTRRRLHLDGNTPVIGMVARFDPLKDHQNLIAALQIVRERGGSFICLLVGAGMTPANKQMKTLLEQAGLKDCVRLLGPLDDVAAIMNALDLHVLSSAGESFPNVLAEAMACGTPCVTTAVGDAALIVGDQGWTVPPRCAPALANAILAALAERASQPCRWQQRQTTGRDRIVQRYALDRMTDAYRNLWSELQTSMPFQVQAHRP